MIKVELAFSGRYEIILEDESGKIKEHKVVDNMLLDGFFKTVCQYKRPLYTAIAACEIGDGDTPVQPTDTGLSGNVLASVYGSSENSIEGEYPVYKKVTYTFAAGVGTGTIKEIGIRSSWSGLYTSRIVLDEPIEKGDFDKLTVIYTLSAKRGGSWTGTITGGQRDGETDIDYTVSMNNRQLFQLFHNQYETMDKWPSSGRVTIGDSNAPSDLENDTYSTIKGNKLFEGVPMVKDFKEYSEGDNFVDMVLGLEDSQVEGEIGEILFRIAAIGYFRVTFNPKLDKTGDYRLYMTLRYQFTRGESTATMTEM